MPAKYTLIILFLLSPACMSSGDLRESVPPSPALRVSILVTLPSTATATPTPTGTPTPTPTATPFPTETFTPLPPSATATAIPPTATVAPTEMLTSLFSSAQGSLGVNRAAVQSAYERAGVVFRPAADVQGQPAVLGEAGSGIVLLVGPAESLTGAAVRVATRPHLLENTQPGVLLRLLPKVAVPYWAGSGDWFTGALSETAATGEPARTTYNNLTIQLLDDKATGLMILTILPVP